MVSVLDVSKSDGESGGASGLAKLNELHVSIGLEAGMLQKKAFHDPIDPDTNFNVLQDEVQCNVTLRITLLLEGQADELDRHTGFASWRAVDQHVSHGQKQQRDGVLPQRLAETRRHRPIRLPLDRKLVRHETPGRVARPSW
ncbi:hypothetical protein Droror1_Dr00001243 [Drosera rotundifolia]